MDSVAKEQWALAVLTAQFDCAQQKFFQAEYGRRRRSPGVALALCLTLGLFGAHEFYLGRLRSAALRLLFCWTLIPLLLALIEASFLTRRVHAYNTRMAHTLAEIVEETFAATRAQATQVAQVAQVAQAAQVDQSDQASWQAGVARTFEPAEAIRRRQVMRTTPLAEERQATVAPPIASRTEPLIEMAFEAPVVIPVLPPAMTSVALPELAPVVAVDAVADAAPTIALLPDISRLRQAKLGPSLDALLVLLPTSAGAAPASEPALLVVSPAPVADVAAAPTELPVALDVVEVFSPAESVMLTYEPDVSNDSVAPDAQDEPNATYAKLTAADEPSPAIMFAEPARGDAASEPAPVVEPVALSQPAQRVQRIVVRKVALVDGRAIAEARATRDVVIPATDAEAQARIAAATDEARAEAMRLLSALVPAETLGLASGV